MYAIEMCQIVLNFRKIQMMEQIKMADSKLLDTTEHTHIVVKKRLNGNLRGTKLFWDIHKFVKSGYVPALPVACVVPKRSLVNSSTSGELQSRTSAFLTISLPRRETSSPLIRRSLIIPRKTFDVYSVRIAKSPYRNFNDFGLKRAYQQFLTKVLTWASMRILF